MNEATQDASIEQQAREFYAGAQRRALWIGSVLAALAIAAMFAIRGIREGGALLAGTIVGGLNTWWLARSTAAFAAKVVRFSDPAEASKRPGGAGVLFRFLLRYVVVMAAAYAIFKSSVFSILAFFTGLFLPVAALMLEAFYEAWVSYRRGL